MRGMWNFRRDLRDLSGVPRHEALVITVVSMDDDSYLVKNPGRANTEYSESFRVAVPRIVCDCGKRLPAVRARKE